MVEPIGDQWLQTAEINSKLSQIAGLLALQYGTKFDPQSVEDNMPSRYYRPEKRKQIVALQSDEKTEFERVASAFGLAGVVQKYGRSNKPS